MRTKTFLVITLLSCLLLGCTPRPPTWPPFPDRLVETARWYLDADRYQRSAHGTLACSECHSDIQTGDPAVPHPDAARLTEEATALFDYKSCEACHPETVAAYQQGAHADAMANPEEIKADVSPPTCGHCHNAHYAVSQTRTELLASVSETCGDCHLEALESYQHNYHGKAALLGYEQTATCTDCHGAHTVLTLYEADESIPACRRCHPEATDDFVSVRIHPQETLNPDREDPGSRNAQLFFLVKLFFTCLVVAVLAFCYTHTGLWFLRSLHEKLRRKHHD